jgi:PKD repeat protein
LYIIEFVRLLRATPRPARTHFFCALLCAVLSGPGLLRADSLDVLAGGPGNALRFDGVNDAVVVPDSPSVRITNVITIEAWINRTEMGVQHSIMEKYGCPGEAPQVGGWAFRVGDDDKLIFYTLDDCNNGSFAHGTTALENNTWYHVIGQFDGAEIRVYVNGSIDGASDPTTRNPKAGNTPLRIGERGNTGTSFHGMMDEVRLWSVVRSFEEIQANMARTLVGNEPGLAGYWRFDEAAGLVANDSSTHGNSGALVNGPVRVASSAPLGIPVVATAPATDITTATATLLGTVNPNRDATTAYFEWGTSSSFGQITPAQSMGNGSNTLALTAAISGLTEGVVYHFRAVAYNSTGTNAGVELTFTTPTAPTAVTGPAGGLTGNEATLNAVVLPNLIDTTAYFEWGATTNYGNTTLTQFVSGTIIGASVSESLAGLLPATLYHFRVVAYNSSGTSFGADVEFSTLSPPTVETQPPTALSGNGGTFNGVVNPNGGDTEAHFEWGTDTSYGNTTPAQILSGSASVLLTETLFELSPGATYHYRVVASNSVGSSAGLDQSFTLPLGGGYALQFDGVDDAVMISDSPSLHITNTITVEAWIKRSVMGAQHSIMEKYGCLPGQGGFVLRVTAGNKLFFGTRDDCNNGSSVTGSSTLQSNVWYHVAGLWDGAALRVYVNGALDGVEATTRNPKLGNTTLRIGERGNDGTFFQGQMDEIRLWSIARSSTNLSQNMNRRLAGTEPGLAGYWRFDEGAGAFANDATANANHGALTNGPVWVVSTIPLGLISIVTVAPSGVDSTSAALNALVNPNGEDTSVYFEWGENVQYGNTTAVQVIPGAAGISVVTESLSVLTPGTRYHCRAIAFNTSGGTNYGADLTFLTPQPPTATTLPATAVTAISVTLNSTVNPNGGATTVFFQWGLTTNYDHQTPAQSIGSATVSLHVSSALSTTLDGLAPSATYHYRVVASNVVGMVSDGDASFTVPAAPVALTQAASGITGNGATLNASVSPSGVDTTVAFQWGATTNYGNSTADQAIGNGTNFVAVTSALTGLTPGQLIHFRVVASNANGTTTDGDRFFITPPLNAGSALQFDGVDDLVSVPDSPSLRITNVITVEAWIKRAAMGVQHGIVEKYGCAGEAAKLGGYTLRVGADNKLTFHTEDDCSTGSSVIGGTTLLSNIWYHVAGEWDGTQLRVYVNGALDGTVATTRAPKAGNTPLKIGERGNGGAGLNGVIDEVRVWSVARTTAEIQSGRTNFLMGVEPGLAGYWRLDEGTGLIAHDSTANANDGTLLNGPIWVDGYDAATRPQPPAVDFSGSPLSGLAPLSVSFTNLTTGQFTSLNWSFGDGTSSTANNPAKTYTNAGTYTVTLSASGPGGSNTLARMNYIVATNTPPPAPVADFNAGPRSGTVPLTVTFLNLSTGIMSSVNWAFGDGTASAADNPLKSYTNAGTYTVTLTANGPGGSTVLTRAAYIVVTNPPPPPPPLADFSASPLIGLVPLTVNFTNLTTGAVTAFDWAFGDGASSSNANPIKTYTNAGSYTITLTASGPGGAGALTRTNYVVVTNAPPPAPIPDFAAAPLVGVAPLTVNFTNLTTGAVTAFDWALGDGASSTNASPVMTYVSAGSYTVTLTAAGPGGASSVTRTSYIVVTNPLPPAPIANFSASPLTGLAPLTVNFNNLTSGSAASYDWSFGDGASSTKTSPTKIYTNAGVYSVTLTATGPGGAHAFTRTNYITVTDPPPPQPLRLSITMDEPHNAVQLTVRGAPGRTNLVEFTTDFGGWTLLTTFANASGTNRIVDPMTPDAHRFYRVRQSP